MGVRQPECPHRCCPSVRRRRLPCATDPSFQGFAQPANVSFVYPKTTGLSYSLCVARSLSDTLLTRCSTQDGFYEIARYRMKGNGESAANLVRTSADPVSTPRHVPELHNWGDELVPWILPTSVERIDPDDPVG